ncbi:unnamed protein product, partial [Polarella glacialis]
IAEYIMDAFPPGSSKGVEVDEVHERRGDTLLHLLCGGKSFSKEAATLFKRVTAMAPDALFQRVNQAGLSFLQIAASTMNFWVLTFMLKNFQEKAKMLICSPSHAALKSMVQ